MFLCLNIKQQQQDKNNGKYPISTLLFTARHTNSQAHLKYHPTLVVNLSELLYA